VTEGAPTSGLKGFTDIALFVGRVFIIVISVDALSAPATLLKVVFLITLVQQVEIDSLNLNDLVALFALS
jgi:hypothetical protein